MLPIICLEKNHYELYELASGKNIDKKLSLKLAILLKMIETKHKYTCIYFLQNNMDICIH